jgi:hypothetical protein
MVIPPSRGFARKTQFLPPDQRDLGRPVPSGKNILVFRTPKSLLYPQPSTPLEGRIAIVTDAGLDAMDAGGASDESVLLADGEVVWS